MKKFVVYDQNFSKNRVSVKLKIFTHASKVYYDFIVNNKDLQGGKLILKEYNL